MENRRIEIALISDLHYYSETLGNTGRAYELRSGSDQKCLAETKAIIKAAFNEIAQSDCSAVLIAGDVTNDGEEASHLELVKELRELRKHKPVYVITATHDWCSDKNARRYQGNETFHDVKTLSPPEIRELYRNFGASDAISEFETHLGNASYCVKLGAGFRLLALNDDSNGKGKAGYTDEHLKWILEQIEDAKKSGDQIIAMQHHLLFPSISPLINSTQIIGESEKISETLADAGLEFIFVGHSHMQRTSKYVSKNNNTIYQVNLGSLTGYPAPITYFTIEDEKAVIEVKRVESFTYNDKEYSSNFLRKHTAGVLTNLFDSTEKCKAEFIERAAALGIKGRKIKRLFPLFKLIFSLINKSTVGKAGRIINFFTFGLGIDKKALKEAKDKKLKDIVISHFLSVFDGTVVQYSPWDPIFIITHDAASLPRRIISKLPLKSLKKPSVQNTLKEIEVIAEKLVSPPDISNTYAVIELSKDLVKEETINIQEKQSV